MVNVSHFLAAVAYHYVMYLSKTWFYPIPIIPLVKTNEVREMGSRLRLTLGGKREEQNVVLALSPKSF